MTIQFSCTICGKSLSTSDDKAGRKAKCPGCGEMLVVPPLEGASADEEEMPLAEEEDALPSVSRKKAARKVACPMCGGQVSASASQCKFCGEPLEPQQQLVSGRLEIAEVFSTTWDLFRQEMGMVIGGVIVAGLMRVVVFFMLYIVMGVMIFALIFAGAGNGGPPNLNAGPILGLIAVAIFFVLAIMLFNSWIGMGETKLLLSVVNNQDASLGQLFQGGPYMLRHALSTFVLSLIAGLVTVPLFIVAAFVVAAAGNDGGPAAGGILILMQLLIYVVQATVYVTCWPYAWVLSEESSTGLSCLSRAFQITKGNRLVSLALLLIACLINLLGLVAFFIGLIFTVPFTLLGATVAYRHLNPRPLR